MKSISNGDVSFSLLNKMPDIIYDDERGYYIKEGEKLKWGFKITGKW